MKKFVLAALAASVALSPIAAAPALAAPQYGQQQKKIVVTKKVVKQNNKAQRQAYRQWRKGERFDARQARNYRVVNDYRARRLAPPPRGYRYVQSGDDAVLIGITSGVIAAILSGALR